MSIRKNVQRLGLVALLALLAPSAIAAAGDPADGGPFTVSREEYDFGDGAFRPVGFPIAVELTASVHYPAGLPGGPYPLVVFLHGRHSTCYVARIATLAWPCPPPSRPIPSYQGYDYVAQVLASWGYIVVSISANGINAYDNSTADYGMSARAQLVQKHLELWRGYTTDGGSPFGSAFVGKVDLNNVGTMGHSRGGEGVVTHYNLNKTLGSPYNVRAVFPLAPVDFARPVVNGAAVSILLPYCDGDVSDLQGVHYYDDARYSVPGDAATKNTLLVLGANHNFFNTVWTPGLFPAGAVDDWLYVPRGQRDPQCGPRVPGSGRLTDSQQRSVGLAYIAGFFRTILGGENFGALFSGDMSRPASIGAAQVWVSYHAPDTATGRRDVNRLLGFTNLSVNTLGGAVTQSGLTAYSLCGGAGQPAECYPPASYAQQPHTTPSALSSAPGLSQLQASWSSPSASFSNDLPANAADVSGFAALVFRAGVNWGDHLTPANLPSDLTVVLTDEAGRSTGATVGASTGALFYPPGTVNPVPKLFLNTVRIPLTAFPGIDLTSVRRVTFLFDQRSTGALLIADIAFSD